MLEIPNVARKSGGWERGCRASGRGGGGGGWGGLVYVVYTQEPI